MSKRGMGGPDAPHPYASRCALLFSMEKAVGAGMALHAIRVTGHVTFSHSLSAWRERGALGWLSIRHAGPRPGVTVRLARDVTVVTAVQGGHCIRVITVT